MYQEITVDFKKLAEDAIDEVLKEKRLNYEREMMKSWSVEILRYPTEEDWKRCLMLARCTQGKFDTPNEPTDDWRKKILRTQPNQNFDVHNQDGEYSVLQ